MRSIALAALAVALFMAGIEIAWMIKQATSDVPFCSAFTWLDCTAVMTHPRWSKWLGIPVAFPAVLVHVLTTGALFAMSNRRGERTRGGLWWWLLAAAMAVLISAGWFTYLQVAEIGRICLWCMVEHLLGATLAVLILLFGPWRNSAILLGALGGFVLIAGQVLVEPSYVRITPGVGQFDEKGRYAEPAEEGGAVLIQGGWTTLNRAWHPMIGNARAQHVLVEVIDYTCPRCRGLHERLMEAKKSLGDDYALLIVTFPLDKDCNPNVHETESRHRLACEFAKLAHAVFMVDPAKFAEMHAWLFAQQDKITYEQAMTRAQELVDPSRLAGQLTSPRMDELIKRDVDLAVRIGVRQLPGLFIQATTFTDTPEDPVVLADQIRRAAEEK
jgi:uncharacterized membrane protein/protein-disulfide isomerase